MRRRTWRQVDGYVCSSPCSATYPADGTTCAHAQVLARLRQSIIRRGPASASASVQRRVTHKAAEFKLYITIFRIIGSVGAEARDTQGACSLAVVATERAQHFEFRIMACSLFDHFMARDGRGGGGGGSAVRGLARGLRVCAVE